jgi:hypothetical protein
MVEQNNRRRSVAPVSRRRHKKFASSGESDVFGFIECENGRESFRAEVKQGMSVKQKGDQA